MNEKRNIVINVLPQSADAWAALACITFFVSSAFAFNSMAGCAARESEARFKAQVETSKSR